MRPLPPPVAERIDYNPDTRTLTLYPLPPSSRWVVRHTADVAAPELQAGATHVLAENDNPELTYVAYRRPSGQVSTAVTVSDIIAARATHASNVP